MADIPYAYRRLGLGVEKTPAQQDIAKITNKAAEMLAVGGAAGVDLASGVGNYFLGTPKTELYKGLVNPLNASVGAKPVTAAGMVAQSPVPATPAAAVGKEGATVEAPAKPAVPENVKAKTPNFAYPEGVTPTEEDKADPYKFAGKLTNEQFKKFVDLNEDDPNFKGMGYVTVSGWKSGKKGFQKVISPETGDGMVKTLNEVIRAVTGKGPEQVAERRFDKGVEVPSLSKDQLAAVSGIMQAKTTAEEGAASRLGIAKEGRESREFIAGENRAERKEARAEAIRKEAALQDMTNLENYMKVVKIFAPVENVDELVNGQMVTSKKLNIKDGMRAVEAAGYKIPKGIEKAVDLETKLKPIPPGAISGTFNGKKAYQLKGKFYDRETGVEIK